MQKRALSDVVTITIIILLAIASIIIVWRVVISMLSSTSSEIDSALFTTSFSLQNIQLDEATKYAKVQVQRTSGDAEISELKIILEDENGNSKTFNQSNVPKELESKVYDIYYASLGLSNTIKKISVFPTIKTSSGKEITGQISSTKEIKNPINYKFKDNNGLIGYWDFNEIINEAGVLKVRDKSGNNNNGELMNNPMQVNSKTTNLGKALQFDSIDDYINMGNPANLNLDFNKISIAFWMFANPSTNSDAGLVGKATLFYGTTYHTGSAVYFYIKDGGNSVAGSVSQNAWHHIVGTFNGTSLLLYVDGALQSTNNNAIYPSTGTGGTFTIGKATTLFNGIIDEARIYNKALTHEEIIGLYEQGF